ncbi:hypothetical protein NE237_000575 [Protea cynaroides]|uniref:Uncharacterized protein n=1 Tax=Protea cynaroides TaxID=273540 RepID=A0A9Q0KRU5_9MAGN|nr:hypothetical protein NE237_000575 [Protea cynaroides]
MTLQIDYDLRAIPGTTILAPTEASSSLHRENKRMKPTSTTSTSSASAIVSSSSVAAAPVEVTPIKSARPVLLVDSQENGIRLIHGLMACALAVEHDNLKLAEAPVQQIQIL